MDYNLIGFWNKSEIDYIKHKIKNISKDDIGIACITNVINDIGEKPELIFNLEQ